MKIFKYGGTALKSKLNRIAIIKKLKNIDDNIIIIASAFKDSPYSTSSLKSLIANNYNDKMKESLIILGEIISSIVLTNELLNDGIDAINIYPNEIGIHIRKNDDLIEVISLDNTYILKKSMEHKIVVVPGFIGIDENNNYVSLNKNGGDLTAILVAKMLNINEVTLYKDVLGLSSIDPSIYSNYKLYDEVSLNQMQIINEHGNNLIQKMALRYANDYGIDITISHFLNDTSKTFISKKTSKKAICFSYMNKTIFVDGLNDNEKIASLLISNHMFYDYIINNNMYLKIITSFNNELEITLYLHHLLLKGEFK